MNNVNTHRSAATPTAKPADTVVLSVRRPIPRPARRSRCAQILPCEIHGFVANTPKEHAAKESRHVQKTCPPGIHPTVQTTDPQECRSLSACGPGPVDQHVGRLPPAAGVAAGRQRPADLPGRAGPVRPHPQSTLPRAGGGLAVLRLPVGLRGPLSRSGERVPAPHLQGWRLLLSDTAPGPL